MAALVVFIVLMAFVAGFELGARWAAKQTSL
jgi:hypothetical protein